MSTSGFSSQSSSGDWLSTQASYNPKLILSSVGGVTGAGINPYDAVPRGRLQEVDSDYQQKIRHQQIAQIEQAAMRQPPQSAPAPPTPRKGHMLKELFGDLRGYIKENRDLIFSIVFVLVLDEYVFEGAFRERLKGVIEGVLKRVERKTGIDIPGV